MSAAEICILFFALGCATGTGFFFGQYFAIKR